MKYAPLLTQRSIASTHMSRTNFRASIDSLDMILRCRIYLPQATTPVTATLCIHIFLLHGFHFQLSVVKELRVL